MKIKKGIDKKDRKGIEAIVRSAHFFNEEEIAVALELVDEKLKLGDKSTYQFLIAYDNEIPAGYSCYGRIPGTQSSFDLYWIAVHEKFRNQGVGKLVLKETENEVLSQGGLNLYVETAGKDQYKSTHQFYLHEGFILEGRLKDYYAIGDDKLLFTKKLK